MAALVNGHLSVNAQNLVVLVNKLVNDPVQIPPQLMAVRNVKEKQVIRNHVTNVLAQVRSVELMDFFIKKHRCNYGT